MSGRLRRGWGYIEGKDEPRVSCKGRGYEVIAAIKRNNEILQGILDEVN
ncbi:hypothetical protein MNV_990009 [Candidatus Methanoperedens nitroreducens]|uniref:Uncharacterized protein n=1 Tax=Candidatus Methanoperedens nitratireducens TaxID=1392998 RepID=A0A284VUT9_9EURY|nr:hypothetical protein MNV_990009 [Candidatus Methanoperedens nitroreducens]